MHNLKFSSKGVQASEVAQFSELSIIGSLAWKYKEKRDLVWKDGDKNGTEAVYEENFRTDVNGLGNRKFSGTFQVSLASLLRTAPCKASF